MPLLAFAKGPLTAASRFCERNGSTHVRHVNLVAVTLAVVAFALFATDATASAASVRLLDEFRPIGAVGNNLKHPSLNPVPGNPELQLAPLTFAPHTRDGLATGPNPRTISNEISGATGGSGTNGETTDPTRSAWLYVFGQFVDHDLGLEVTPPTTPAIDIVVPAGDPVFTAGTVISMTRDVRSTATNTIVNSVAGFLDLSQLYGSTPAVAATLTNLDGTLKTSDHGQALSVVDDHFVLGDPRGTENPELTAVIELFMREHNRWVSRLRGQHPDWTSAQLYGMAKAITTAEYQNIIYSEYLPALIGPVLGAYGGYDPRVNPQETQEFSGAAFRLHTQVSDTQEGLDNAGNTIFAESLAQSFFNTPEIDEANGIDALLRSLGVDYAQATDPYTVSALRNLLVAGLVGGDIDKMDLIAIDIQRERDIGLATLNATRRSLGMKPYTSFWQLTSDPVLLNNFQAVYGNIDNVDLFMGGLAEAHATGAAVGPTFQAIIADQFWRVRAGDRFFWQNEGFDSQTASLISRTTLTTLMKRDTTTTANLQADLFIESSLPARHVKAHVTQQTCRNKIRMNVGGNSVGVQCGP